MLDPSRLRHRPARHARAALAIRYSRARHNLRENPVLRLVQATLAVLLLAPLTASAAEDLSGAHDFDFEFGDWIVHHRLKRASGEWIEFEGTSTTWAVLDGRGNVEDNVFHRPGGDTRGLATRAYAPATGTWAIWWLDSRAPHGAMYPPVKGKFVNGVGHFYSDSEVNGKMVRTRYT